MMMFFFFFGEIIIFIIEIVINYDDVNTSDVRQ